MTEQEIMEKARELKREASREWRRKNPEKQKEYTNRYWAKKAREALEAENG